MLSAIAARFASNVHLRGPMEDATHVGVSGVPGDGPYIKFWFRLSDNRILKASFDCNGCPSSLACSGLIAEIAQGREIEKLKLLTEGEILLLIGGLPEGKEYYAEVAVKALLNICPIGS